MKKSKKTGFTVNIPNNFRGKEDIFWIKIKKGIKKFLEPAFKEK
jgi:hypothetical protein